MAGTAKTITAVWADIDAALAKVSPRAAAKLRKPATSKALAALAAALDGPVPVELAASLSIHDGQDDKARLPVVFVKTAWFLLPAAGIVSAFEALEQLAADGEFDDREGSNQDGFVQPKWWSAKWVPFAVNAAGDHLCIDLGPTRKGKAGQLLWWYHDEDFREREHVDLTSFLRAYADALSSGQLTVRPDGGIVGDV